MFEYINKLRVRRYSIEDAAVEGAVLRLRPIMMTMLVATLGCCLRLFRMPSGQTLSVLSQSLLSAV